MATHGRTLVYSTGLFDYLPARVGRRLVRSMRYMEAFMDWNLVYRSRQDMIELTHDLPEADVKNVQLWSEEALNIIFLRVTKQ